MNGDVVSMGSLSGGELKALSLCADFALIDVLDKQFAIKINPVILDESFNSLDAVGKETVIKLLTSIGKDRLVVVVDHMSEIKSMFDSILRVEKRNKVTTIASDSV
jgi:DNA repair exonuclease SbcCD ATPase subunit